MKWAVFFTVVCAVELIVVAAVVRWAMGAEPFS